MQLMGHIKSLQFTAGPNFGVSPAADKKNYLQLTVKNLHAFAVFTEKKIQPYRCNFTAAVNCTNSKTKMKTKILEMQIILLEF